MTEQHSSFKWAKKVVQSEQAVGLLMCPFPNRRAISDSLSVQIGSDRGVESTKVLRKRYLGTVVLPQRKSDINKCSSTWIDDPPVRGHRQPTRPAQAGKLCVARGQVLRRNFQAPGSNFDFENQVSHILCIRAENPSGQCVSRQSFIRRVCIGCHSPPQLPFRRFGCVRLMLMANYSIEASANRISSPSRCKRQTWVVIDFSPPNWSSDDGTSDRVGIPDTCSGLRKRTKRTIGQVQVEAFVRSTDMERTSW